MLAIVRDPSQKCSRRLRKEGKPVEQEGQGQHHARCGQRRPASDHRGETRLVDTHAGIARERGAVAVAGRGVGAEAHIHRDGDINAIVGAVGAHAVAIEWHVIDAVVGKELSNLRGTSAVLIRPLSNNEFARFNWKQQREQRKNNPKHPQSSQATQVANLLLFCLGNTRLAAGVTHVRILSVEHGELGALCDCYITMESSPSSGLGAKSRGKFKRDTLQDLFPANNTNTKEASSPSDRKLDYETVLHAFPRDDRNRPVCKCGEVLSRNFWCVPCAAFCVNNKGLVAKDSSKTEEEK